MIHAYPIRFLLFFACFTAFKLHAKPGTFDVRNKRDYCFVYINFKTDTAKAQPPQDKNIKAVPKSKRKSRPVEVKKEQQKKAAEKKEAAEKVGKPQKTERPEKNERPEVKRPETKERPEAAHGKGNGKN